MQQDVTQAGETPSLRVAVLTTSFPLTPESPSGVFVARLFDYMPSGIEARIITPADTGISRPVRRGASYVIPVRYGPRRWQRLAHSPGGVPVTLRNHPWLYLLVPIMLASLACRLYQEARKCDVIHANWAINGLIAGLVGKLAGRPTLTTIRGEDAARSRRSRGARLILASAIRLSSRVTAVSTDMAAWLQDEFPHARQKIRACENGIDPDFLAFEREYSRTDTPVTITTVGSLIPRKGIEVLIRALARLNDVRWIFRVVGSGPEEEALRRLVADLAIEPKVVFVGKLPPADILPELSKADIFVLGSYSEGRPNVLVEAMSTALPVVASRIEGVAELIEEGISGLTVPAGNVPAWTVVLERLLADAELRQRLGFAARQRILALGLSWETTAARYVQEYRSMVRD